MNLLHTLTQKCSHFIRKLLLFCLKHRIWRFHSFETTQFSQNGLLIDGQFFCQVVVICLRWFCKFKMFYEVLTFNIWKQKCKSIISWQLQTVTQNSEILTTANSYSKLWNLDNCKQLLETLKADFSSEVYKRSLSDWVGPSCKC